jgi:hypothetical protein
MIQEQENEIIFLKLKTKTVLKTSSNNEIEFYEGFLFDENYEKQTFVAKSTDLIHFKIESLEQLFQGLTKILNIPCDPKNLNSRGDENSKTERLNFSYSNNDFEIIDKSTEEGYFIKNTSTKVVKIGMFYFEELTSFINYKL